jgi:hypothetical protein
LGVELGERVSEVKNQRTAAAVDSSCGCEQMKIDTYCLSEVLPTSQPFFRKAEYCFAGGRLGQIRLSRNAGEDSPGNELTPVVAGLIKGARGLWGEPDGIRVAGRAAGDSSARFSSISVLWRQRVAEVVLDYPATPESESGGHVGLVMARPGLWSGRVSRSTDEERIVVEYAERWPEWQPGDPLLQ